MLSSVPVKLLSERIKRVNDFALHMPAGNSPESMLLLRSSSFRDGEHSGGSDPLKKLFANIMEATLVQLEIHIGMGPDSLFEFQEKRLD